MARLPDAALTDRRRRNIGRLLTLLASDFQSQVLTRLHAAGFIDLRPAHNAILMNVDLEGTRITTIAERAAITRQAVGQLVDDLSALGYVERSPDPTDGRAQNVSFTVRGRAMLDAGVAAITEVEGVFVAHTDLRRLLEETAERLDIAALGDERRV